MKILHLSLKPIYPIVDGGCAAMDNFLKLLAKTYENIDHICISTQKHPFFAEEYENQLPKNVQLLQHFPVNTRIDPAGFFFSLVQKTPYQIKRFYDKKMANHLAGIAKNYDYVFLESAFLLPYLDVLQSAKNCFVRTHNAEFKLWATRAHGTVLPFRRLILSRLTKQMLSYEVKNLSRANGLIHISSDDEKTFKELIPTTKHICIPVGLDVSFLQKPTDISIEQLRFGFLGASNWSPNMQAVEQLTEEIFPTILKKYPTSKLFLAGHGWENYEFDDEGIVNLGTVATTNEFFNQISIFLAPLQSGSGLKIKMVEALTHGKPIIGSKIAFEGLEFLSQKHLAETADDFLVEIEKMLQQSDISQETEHQQKAVFEEFGEEKLIQKLKDFVC